MAGLNEIDEGTGHEDENQGPDAERGAEAVG